MDRKQSTTPDREQTGFIKSNLRARSAPQKSMTFVAWLKLQTRRFDAVGAFARWVETRNDKPHGRRKSPIQWRRWLWMVRAQSIEVMYLAWDEYQKDAKEKRLASAGTPTSHKPKPAGKE